MSNLTIWYDYLSNSIDEFFFLFLFQSNRPVYVALGVQMYEIVKIPRATGARFSRFAFVSCSLHLA